MSYGVLKKVTIDDRKQLQQISRKAYYLNYFDHWNSQAGIESYLEDQFGDARLTNDLSNKNVVYHFIKFHEKTVGFTKLNLTPRQFSDLSCCELEKIYLLPKYIGKGIGKKALKENLSFAQRKQKSGVILYVIDTNRRALEFYKGFGFEVEEKSRFLISDFKDEFRGLLKMKLSFNEIQKYKE